MMATAAKTTPSTAAEATSGLSLRLTPREIEIAAAAFLSSKIESAQIDMDKMAKFLGCKGGHSMKTSYGMVKKKFLALATEDLPEGELLQPAGAKPTVPRKRRAENGDATDAAGDGDGPKPKPARKKAATAATRTKGKTDDEPADGDAPIEAPLKKAAAKKRAKRAPKKSAAKAEEDHEDDTATQKNSGEVDKTDKTMEEDTLLAPADEDQESGI